MARAAGGPIAAESPLISPHIRFISDTGEGGGMSTPEVADETTVNDSHSVTVPSEIRERLDIEPGDKLRWTLAEDGELRVEVVRERYGAFADMESVDVGQETNAVEETEDYAYRVD